jgi:hypothetical protein
MRTIKAFLLRILDVFRYSTVAVCNLLRKIELRFLWQDRRRLAACSAALIIVCISLVALYFQYHVTQASGATYRRAATGQSPQKTPELGMTPSGIIPTSSVRYTITPASGTVTPPFYVPTSGVVPSNNGSDMYPTASAYPTSAATSPPVTGPVAIARTATPQSLAPARQAQPTTSATKTPTLTVNPTSRPTAISTPPVDPTATVINVPDPTATATSVPDPTATVINVPDPTATATSEPEPTVSPVPIVGVPTLTRLELVTSNAYGVDGDYVPNSWGVQKNRLIRTSNGDIFMVYISAGSGANNRAWHLMRRDQQGVWQEVDTGNAGEEEVNILLGPHDQINLFVWPGAQGILDHIVSTDYGATFRTEQVPGQWIVDQGYSGSTIDPAGNMIIFQTGADIPGTFLWSYYSVQTQQWTFHTTSFDYRYTYAFFFLGTQHPGSTDDLTITAMRDVLRQELGYPEAPSGDFDYIFNAIEYFHFADLSQATFQQLQVTQVQPQSNADADITYMLDSYVDSYGRTHIIYNDLYDRTHHVIIENGKVIENVLMNVSSPLKVRITQDAAGHFYVITMSADGKALNIYPGTASDTDGTQLAAPVQLDISRLPGCNDYDFCHEPTFTIPRAGNANSNIVDGVYGNYNQEIYFQINLHGQSTSSSSVENVPAFASLNGIRLAGLIDPSGLLLNFALLACCLGIRRRAIRQTASSFSIAAHSLRK